MRDKNKNVFLKIKYASAIAIIDATAPDAHENCMDFYPGTY